MMRGHLFGLIVIAVVASARPARAGELDVAGGIGATTSEWEGDSGYSSSLKVGYFFSRLPWLAPIFVGRYELVPVDDRMVHYFSVGAEARRGLGPVRGYVRAGLVHVHEESRSAFRDHFFQSILGIGDGLRHRAGGNLGAGVELPLRWWGDSDLYAVLDISTTGFTDDRGPAWYLSGTLGVGYRWDRGSRPAAPAPGPAPGKVARAR